MIPERWKTREMSPTFALVSYVEGVSRLWHRERKPRWNLADPDVGEMEVRVQGNPVDRIRKTMCQRAEN